MGADSALAALSDQAPALFSYFKQRFAQVTNPAIDSLREDLVMSLTTWLGRGPELLADAAPTTRRLRLPTPILTAEDLDRVCSSPLPWAPIDATWPISLGEAGLEAAVERVVAAAVKAVSGGAEILVIGDRNVGPKRAPVPALLATAAVHHELVRAGLRTRTSLVIDSGEPREVHHFACLVGYGADAVHGWLAGDGIARGLGPGLLKTMSKMGVSTVSAYRGAQVFEAIGLAPELVDRYFTGTPSKVGGIGLRGLAREVLMRHARSYLPVGGIYRWRRGGERHAWNPDTVPALQRGEWRPCVEAADEAARHGSLRGQLAFRETDGIDLDNVEPVTEIMNRFVTGAMSLGSISPEAHEALAVAMNEIGGRSNTGEGGRTRRALPTTGAPRSSRSRPSHRMQWVSRAGPSRICVTLSPSPTAISTFSSATSRPVKTSSQCPPCSSGPMIGMRRTISQPGWSRSNRNALSPRRGSSEVRAIRMKCWAAPAPVMNHLRPSITQRPSRRSALVRIMPGSEPPPGAGSVMANAERTLPSTIGVSHRSRCASLPTAASSIMLPSSGAAALKTTGPKIERLASWYMTAMPSRDSPIPPSARGVCGAHRPAALAWARSASRRSKRMFSCSSQADRSASTGITTSATNSRVRCRRRSSSGGRAKSMAATSACSERGQAPLTA